MAATPQKTSAKSCPDWVGLDLMTLCQELSQLGWVCPEEKLSVRSCPGWAGLDLMILNYD